MKPTKRQLTVFLCFLSLQGPAGAAYLVDTGTPNNFQGFNFEPGQYFAGEFSIAAPVIVQSIEGYNSNI